MIRKIFLIILLLAINCKLFAVPAVAKDFSSFYKTTYDFLPSGEGSVTSEISIVNLNPNLYVSEYTLSTIGGDIGKIEAYDKIGPLKVKTIVKDKTNIITLNFNDKVVGKDKVQSFILKYNITGLAKKEGNLWQINIPKISNKESIDDYQILLKIPSEFGKLAFINPNPKSEENKGNFHLLSFSGKELFEYGIIATLGQYQTFNFNINYDLKNETTQKRIEKIALPPDTNYQTVFYQKISPEPENIITDQDGNWIALFELYPKQALTVNVQGKVNIFSKPKPNFPDDYSNLNKYLEEKNYWNTKDPKIKELSEKLKTIENIYDYVVNNLKYDYQSVKKNATRNGALKILENPEKSICTDFTDLFVTLSRSAGIPARELEGFAYSENTIIKEISISNDLLHSWPEYFDEKEKEWIMVDPTWENSTGGIDYFHKFDMSHFVFVIHGISDVFPLSAGSYKESPSLGKQILVSISNDSDFIKPKVISLQKIIPNSSLSLKSNILEAEFKNESGFALYSENLFIKNSEIITDNAFQFPLITPFSIFKIKFSISPKEQFKDYKINLIFEIAGNNLEYLFTIKSLLIRIIIFSSFLLSAIIVVILLSIKKSRNDEKTLKNNCY